MVNNNTSLNIQVFGEETSLPISVNKVNIRASDPLPFINKSHAIVELHVENKLVNKRNVAAKLQLSLPLESTVQKFEMEHRTDDDDDGHLHWYPATAVAKKNVKAIVYQEKEKGRAVAAVSNAAAATNKFEMEISPLPYQTVIRCRLEIVLTGIAATQELVEGFASLGEETVVVVEKVPVPSLAPNQENAVKDGAAGAIVGEAFGKIHFVCKIPAQQEPSYVDTKARLDHIAILWDASASTGETKSVDTCCSHLKHLLLAGGSKIIDLYTFGMGTPRKIGTFDNVEHLLLSIRSVTHDGGTDLTTLPPLVSELSKDKSIDAALVFTDGVDSFGRAPVFDDSTTIPFPVHCCVPPHSSTVNMLALKTIAAAASKSSGTVVLTKKKNTSQNSYLPGILYPCPVLHSIQTDQCDEAFMEVIDDGFRCVPDHRLPVLNQPIPAGDGLLISGIVGDSVTKLIALVQTGPNERKKYHFELRPSHSRAVDSMDYPTLFLEPSSDAISRTLGHIYAKERYQEAEGFGIRSGVSTELVREELAVKYGFCSPESSLLMLYRKEQFMDHRISPPEGHPVANEMESHTAANHNHKDFEAGEIGGLKTEEQAKNLESLAVRMKQFFANPETDIQKLRESVANQQKR